MTNYLTSVQILDHFEACDNSYLSALKKKVDILEYSIKLQNNATNIFEMIDEKVIGLLAYYLDPTGKYCFITNLSVIKHAEGSGFGTKLLNRLKARSVEENWLELTLKVDQNNLAALNFYKNRGFVIDVLENDQYVMKLDSNQ